jgi:cytochrome oxidase assembly protein ShyY1
VRLLLTPRWLGLVALTAVAAFVMVLLGRWQWSRYELRSEINARIDASTTATPVPLTPGIKEWSRAAVTGEYDPKLEVLVRNRTVHGRVGYEILTPLILADGSAVLVDRGWVEPDPKGPTVTPAVPAPPTGQVTINGRVRFTESDPKLELRDGHWEARRIGVQQIAAKVPYKLAEVYLLADDEVTDLVPVPSQRENDWLNLGYAFQWWLFATGSFVALAWLARRDIRTSTSEAGASTGGARTSTSDAGASTSGARTSASDADASSGDAGASNAEANPGASDAGANDARASASDSLGEGDVTQEERLREADPAKLG